MGGSPARWLIEAAALALLALGTLAVLRRSTAMPAAKASWLLSGLLALLLTAQVWIEDMAFLRATALFYLFSMIILMNASGALARGLQLLGIAAWAVMALHYLYWR